MCAQSPVLKTMLDSELWAESKNKEVQTYHRLFCMKITRWILTRVLYQGGGGALKNSPKAQFSSLKYPLSNFDQFYSM